MKEYSEELLEGCLGCPTCVISGGETDNLSTKLLLEQSCQQRDRFQWFQTLNPLFGDSVNAMSCGVIDRGELVSRIDRLWCFVPHSLPPESLSELEITLWCDAVATPDA